MAWKRHPFFYFCDVERYFHLDKNHLLKSAQDANKEVMLEKWVLQAVEGYLLVNNPLGLVDDFVRSITSVTHYDKDFLRQTYDWIAGGYRLLYASNQLEFLWDGRSHFEKYSEEWERQFSHWIYGLSLQDQINRSIIRVCVLKEESNSDLLERNFSRLVLGHLNLRWDGRKKTLEKFAS